jgi:GNAT superfamily N-acetyltransferase
MLESDIVPCADLSHRAFDDLRRRFSLPTSEWTVDARRQQCERFTRFLESDPGGSLVATGSDGTVIGMAQAIMRDGLWILSMFAFDPAHQSAGAGSALLREAVAYGDPNGPGLILSSRDLRALRAYWRAGFTPHPAMTAWGPVDPSGLSASARARQGSPDDLNLVAALDKAVRGSNRAEEVRWLMTTAGAELWLADDDGFVLIHQNKAYCLAARDQATAAELLEHALVQVSPDEPCEVTWLTGGQQWAIDVVLRARVDLHPVGPYFVRGLSGPFDLALVCGAFG